MKINNQKTTYFKYVTYAPNLLTEEKLGILYFDGHKLILADKDRNELMTISGVRGFLNVDNSLSIKLD